MKLNYILSLLVLLFSTSCDTTEPPNNENYHNKILFSANLNGNIGDE